MRNAIEIGTDLKRMIFDVCGTLVVENTTVALLEQICTRGGPPARRIRGWHLVAAVGRRLGMLSPSAYMHTRIKGLRGVPRHVIEEEAARLVSEHLTERAIPVELLDLAKQRAIPFGYATYTLAEIVAAIQERFGGAVLCQSELAYDGSGLCTGHYLHSLHDDQKEACIPEEWKAHLREAGFVTDDENADQSLLRAVGYPLLLPPDPANAGAKGWAVSVPGVYYYTSRYRHQFERIIHLFKFWGTYALVFWLTSPTAIHPGCATLGLLAWLAIYDIGCRANDARASSEESGTERRKGFLTSGASLFMLTRLVWTTVCILGLSLWNPMAGMMSTVLLLVLGGVFWLHNRLTPKERSGTFYLLYLLKGAVFPAAAGVTTFPPLLYTAFCALFAMTYLPKYALSKRAQTWEAAEAVRNKLTLQPILGKNASLLLLSAFDIRFVPVLMWVDFATAAEFAFRRNASRKETRDNE
jgi:phosphoserine phosphatase